MPKWSKRRRSHGRTLTVATSCVIAGRYAPDVPDALSLARDLVASSHKIVFLTGAGISTAAGIPDYRGPDGVWTKNPGAERRSHIDTWISDPDAREAGWQRRLHTAWDRVVPTAAHDAITQLAATTRVSLVVTQNIDGLHQRSGLDRNLLVEIHGTVHDSICLSCEKVSPIGPTLERVAAGELDPHCLEEHPEVCGGILKAATISFGQSLRTDDLNRSCDATDDADLFIAIGTTLTVFPVAGLVPRAADRDIPIIIVNGSPTDMDHFATVVLDGDINDVVPQLLAL